MPWLPVAQNAESSFLNRIAWISDENKVKTKSWSLKQVGSITRDIVEIRWTTVEDIYEQFLLPRSSVHFLENGFPAAALTAPYAGI